MRYIAIMVSMLLYGCPLERENTTTSGCSKAVECSIDEEQFCEKPAEENGCLNNCYYNFSEYCVEKLICPKN